MTPASTLPPSLEQVFADHADAPETLFPTLLPAIGEVLQSDRCFLHLRQPTTRLYLNLCWRRHPNLPDTSTHGWEPEQEWEREDPMFAAALRTAPPIFVDDIETADSSVLNVDFERNVMGHRSLVHAHLAEDGVLWGILQPCMFGCPRVWTQGDRAVIHELVGRLTPIAKGYVQSVFSDTAGMGPLP